MNTTVVACLPELGQLVHPIGAVIKNFDKIRAKVLFGIDVKDQRSLDEANQLIEESN